MKTLLRLLQTSRPISWVNTAFPFAAAYLVTNGAIDTIFWVGTIYFLIPYNLLMYGLNDVFDYESDRHNERKSGAEGVVLEKPLHAIVIRTAVALNVPFLYFLFSQGDMASNIVLGGVLFSVLAYSLPGLRFKERPILDSVTSAIHFVGPMLYGIVFNGWDQYYLLYVLSFFAWAMASHAFGAVQDILPDMRAHINSIATFLSARWAVRLSIVLYLISMELLLLRGFLPRLAAALGLLYIINILPYWELRNRDSNLSNTAWRRFLALNYFSGFVITVLLVYANL